MARTIWKFPLSVTDHQVIEMPSDAICLSVAVQAGVVCLWVEVDPATEPKKRLIRIYGTGHPMSEFPGRYLNSFMLMGGDLVFHAYDCGAV
jgi:hypothetical protein